MNYGNDMECSNDPSPLVGKTITRIALRPDNEELLFVCSDDTAFKMYHMRDCCETVSIYDIDGQLSDLIGSPIIEATVDESVEWPSDVEDDGCHHSFTWTTFRLAAENGVSVVIRWLGESNGYYSEYVYFQRTHVPIF